MRGRNERQAKMLFGVTPDDLVPGRHPIRRIRTLVDELLSELSPVFDEMYSSRGRPSIPPEQLLKSTVLMALYSIRSERQFCERLQYDLLFKWFLGLNITDDAFDATAFSHNRKRLLEHEVAESFLGATARAAKTRRLISEEHFTADGTLLQAWASIKSFRPRTKRSRHPAVVGMPPQTSTTSAGATKRTRRRPIRKRDWQRRAAARRPGSPTAATCSQRIAMGSSSTRSCARRTGRPNGRPHCGSSTVRS